MRVHAIGDGAMSKPHLSSALLLSSDCDHCPRVAFFNDFPPLLYPFTKGLGTTSCLFCEIFM